MTTFTNLKAKADVVSGTSSNIDVAVNRVMPSISLYVDDNDDDGITKTSFAVLDARMRIAALDQCGDNDVDT
jgi:hypothetical protein